jgi:opacity protein-like surface antigen
MPVLAAANAPVFYIGAGASFSETGWNFFENDEFLIPYDTIPRNDWSFKILGGVEYRSRYAFEIFYAQSKPSLAKRRVYGEDYYGNIVSNGASFRYDLKELGASAVYYIGSIAGLRASLFAKAGFVTLDCDFTEDGEASVDVGTRAIGYGGGFGLEYRFVENMSARIEWAAQKLSSSRATSIGDTSITLQYRF